jgi:hypothetical protein
MSFRIRGLDPQPFSHLYGLPDSALERHGAVRMIAEANVGFPDRIELRDAKAGEALLLVNYEHQPADTPYRSRHAIFVLEGALVPYDEVGEVPQVLRMRTLSLRSFDIGGMMIDADLTEGVDAEALIERLFAHPAASYIHAHYARRGCFAARIDRA